YLEHHRGALAHMLSCLTQTPINDSRSTDLKHLPGHQWVSCSQPPRLKIQKSAISNATTYRRPNSRKSNFATEPTTWSRTCTRGVCEVCDGASVMSGAPVQSRLPPADAIMPAPWCVSRRR